MVMETTVRSFSLHTHLGYLQWKQMLSSARKKADKSGSSYTAHGNAQWCIYFENILLVLQSLNLEVTSHPEVIPIPKRNEIYVLTLNTDVHGDIVQASQK